MDKEQINHLKELAEKASKYDDEIALLAPQGYVKYVFAATPKAILELIEAYERLEKDFEDAARSAADESVKAVTLEDEANWLAAAQNWDIPADESTRCPEGKEPPDGCIGINDCTHCWRKAAHQAVAEKAEQSDIEPR